MYLDIFIVVVFCIITLWTGFGHGRAVKTITQYAVGDRKFSTVELVSTLVATYLSGSAFSSIVARSYHIGLPGMFTTVFIVLGFMITAFVFLPKMQRFLIYNSIAHALGDIYNNNIIRIIVASTGSMRSIGMVSVQFKVFAIVISYFSNISPSFLVIICGSVVTAYSCLGGIRAVTFTDIIQFTTFSLAIPIIAIMIWNHLYLDPNFFIMDGFKDPKRFNL